MHLYRSDMGDRRWSRVLVLLLAGTTLAACEPTVRVEVPREPITINLNVKIDAQVRVKLEESAEKDIEDNPDVF